MARAYRMRVMVAERLAFREKAVAGGLALATGMLLVMMELGLAYALGLVLLAPVCATPAVRSRVFPEARETFAAYYVAWLYGPLGWGVYRNVPWVQAIGAAAIALLAARALGA